MTDTQRQLVVAGVGSAAFAPLLEILEERKIIAPEQLRLLAADGSETDPQVFANRSIAVRELADFAFQPGQILVLLASGEFAQSCLAAAEAAGAWVLDAAGNTRGDDSVQLIHPLLNAQEIAAAERKLLALPVAGAGMVAEALYPLKGMLQSLYLVLEQPVSALGKGAVDSLAAQTARLFNGQEPELDPETGQRLAFNQLSSSEPLLASGHNLSELALVHELRQLLGEGIAIDASVNTASVFHGQLANLNLGLNEEADLEKIRALLANGARLQMVERPSAQEAVGGETTLVGRLRGSLLGSRQVVFCTASDNLRKDLAINCAQIVQLLLKNY